MNGLQSVMMVIALFAFMNFIMLKNNITKSVFMSVLQSEELYDATNLADSVIDQAWMIPFSQLNNLHNVTQTIVWDGVTYQVTTTVSTYNTDYKLLTVNVVSNDCNVNITLSNVFSDI